MDKDEQRLSITKAHKRTILSAVKSIVESYLESEDFFALVNTLDFKENIDITQMVLDSVGRFTEFSFDDILDISKEINLVGYNFVKSINMPVKFWKRCRDHRNFHAHLTDDKHKGFNGTQSLYAIYTLSTYFRLLILELSGFNNLDFETIQEEIECINNWLENQRISKEISKI